MTIIIIAITVLLFLATMNNPSLFQRLAFDPYMVAHRGQHYRIFTHAFLHGGWAHLLINMFVLYQFGGAVEHDFNALFGKLGPVYYGILYIGGIVASSLPTLKKEADNPYYRAVGASGAVAAVLFSYILMHPTAMLGFMLVIPIPAIVFGVLYIWYEKRMADQGAADGIGHDAHYWGAVFGVVVTLVFKPLLLTHFIDQILQVF